MSFVALTYHGGTGAWDSHGSRIKTRWEYALAAADSKKARTCIRAFLFVTPNVSPSEIYAAAGNATGGPLWT